MMKLSKFSTSLTKFVVDFVIEELSKALSQMKNGKAPGTDSLPVEFWSFLEFLPSAMQPTMITSQTTKPGNYRGISLAQTASKIFNCLILNRIRPAVDNVTDL